MTLKSSIGTANEKADYSVSLTHPALAIETRDSTCHQPNNFHWHLYR
jgi:hypothetical protein